MALFLRISNKEAVFSVKARLKELNLIDKSRKLLKEVDESDGQEVFLIPVVAQIEDSGTMAALSSLSSALTLESRSSAATSAPSQPHTVQGKLHAHAERLLDALGDQITPAVKSELLADLPRGWDRYGDFILLPEASFTHSAWGLVDQAALWRGVSDALQCQRLGKKAKILRGDEMRLPGVSILWGTNDPWVTHVDNGIKCSWNVTRSMFSSGNGTEKKRVAQFASKDMVVVDLYAGIGYFTLPYLIYGRAKFVHACEWNPDAVAALRRNLQDNRVADRCEVYEGDNASVAPTNVADRVNLGLIPSSEKGWPVAARCLKKESGGWLHIHENVTEGQEAEWTARISASLQLHFAALTGQQWLIETRHIERVKSYAPRIFHMVADVECRPPTSSLSARIARDE